LSIVIPSHNRSDLLRTCLNSLARHAPPGTEIIVVDDGSSQGIASGVASEFSAVQSMRSKRSRGFCAAANAGIRVARGAVIEILNDDTEVTPGWAESALKWFDDPAVASVAPLVLRGPLNGSSHGQIDSAGDRYYLGGVAGKRGHGEFLGPDYLDACRVFGASASSAFYRREVVMRLGAFPVSFGAYFEDVDLAFRLNRAGFCTMYEPKSHVLHRGGGSYGAPRRRLLEQQSRNEERVFWRNTPPGAWGEAIPRHLAVLAGKSLRRWQEGQLVPFICGRLRLLGEIQELNCHRRHLNQMGLAIDPKALKVETRFWG
jgi:GT2 family glycosyltransferase